MIKHTMSKELSWLSFNERVLQEACDKNVPLIERVRFLGIFSSNLDEFFRVRVAEIRRAILIDNFNQDKMQHNQTLMNLIQDRVLELQERFDKNYNELMRELARKNIFLINEFQLSYFHQSWLMTYFKDHLKRHISPIIVSKSRDLTQQISDGVTYLCICLYSDKKRTYSLIEVPTKSVPRFVKLPVESTKSKKHLILLDNIIRFCADELFRPFFEYDDIDVYAMKLTKDAEFDITDELDYTQLERMSKGLKKRLTAEPVRLVYDREMPDHMLQMLKSRLKISSTEFLVAGGRYHNFKDFMAFPNPSRKYLEYEKLPAIHSNLFDQSPNVFEAIAHNDILLNYPYHKYSYVTEFVRQAAYDPAVKFINISLYRVAKNSRIIQSLIDAVNNGKKVMVILELRARFDEEANIEWTRKLVEAGVSVHHGIPSLKVHSKICVIGRHEADQTRLYCHIGSGNFNEKTAKVYTDFSLFSANQEIAEEVQQVFHLIQHPYRQDKFNHLIVSPYNSRKSIYRLIEAEITAAKNNKRASITLKVNNLVDKQLIRKLYNASNAGVKIKLLVRGMCSLVPKIPEQSQNIEVVSIVDRFLEHSRIMVFHAGGEQKMFLSSADWMTRNIDNRIEVTTPIYDSKLKKMLSDILNIHFSDNTKARILNAEQSNPYRRRGNKKKVRSQQAIYEYLIDYEAKIKQSLNEVSSE
ncbi:polyphosphate kinase 1 [Parashewanella tropica]|uniref:polyphosphate kinase 1 n=1 Tax=Parashewanella tropica TaxID=2547970 RepID=UPI00105933F9|nr:polyphosphate kinase 1 [Parashewanella tropica]